MALAVAAPVRAERQWTDSRGAQWPSSVSSCVQGEAETRLGELRRASPTTAYRYTGLYVQEWDPGYESICRFVIERRLGYGWVTAEIHDQANYGGGQNDPCPRGGVDETGACMRKSAGAPACPGNGSNPINGGTANKYQREVDYSGPGGNPLLFARHYNHLSTEAGPLGALWRHDYQRRILVVAVSGNQASAVKVYRADGRRYAFTLAGGAWRSDADVVDRLAQRFDATGTPAGWSYTDSSDAVETYDAEGRLIALALRGAVTQTLTYDTNGQLQSVDDGYGHRLLLAYLDTGARGNGRYRLATLTDPAGKLLRYGYDAAGNLATVTYPDGRVRTYHYNERLYTGAPICPTP